MPKTITSSTIIFSPVLATSKLNFIARQIRFILHLDFALAIGNLYAMPASEAFNAITLGHAASAFKLGKTI
jgi:hypothetical protein